MSSKTDPPAVSVLMYHSIATGSGPTCIPRDTFEHQMETLAACGYRSISLQAFHDWHSGKSQLPHRSVLITFDDGFADFAGAAFPILEKHRFAATVFLPTGKIGGNEDWDNCAGATPRPLMNWPEIRGLAGQGVEFGGHSVSHTDLTRLSQADLVREVRQCREDIENHTGYKAISFAPPFGRCGVREVEEIRKSFAMSLGVTLNRAVRDCDIYNVPRIEMHYFRDVTIWKRFLEGNAKAYFGTRRALRGLRRFATGE